MTALQSFETLGIISTKTECHIPEDLNIQQPQCENLKSQKFMVTSTLTKHIPWFTSEPNMLKQTI
jgi:hypothetical protein